MTTTYTHAEEEKIRGMLVGRRVVHAELQREGLVDGHWVDNTGLLILDDGTTLTVYPNSGCGGCPAGNFTLTHLAAVDNVITAVEFDTKFLQRPDPYQQRYQIFVFAGADKINLLTVDGFEDNGYYGTGYRITVSAP